MQGLTYVVRPDVPSPTHRTTDSNAAVTLNEASTSMTIEQREAVQNFSQAWIQAINQADREESYQGLSRALVDAAPFTKDCCEMQETVARCICDFSARSSTLEPGPNRSLMKVIAEAFMEAQDRLAPVDLSLVSKRSTAQLTQFVQTELNAPRDDNFEAMPCVEALRGVLGAEGKREIDLILSTFVLSRSRDPNQISTAEVQNAMLCIGDLPLQVFAAVNLLGELAKRYQLASPPVLPWIETILCTRAPQLPASEVANYARELLAMSDESTGQIRNSMLISCASLVASVPDADDINASLLAKLLKAASDSRSDSAMECAVLYQAAARITRHENSLVGVEFHQYLHEQFHWNSPGGAVTDFAVLSFYLDPGASEFYQTWRDPREGETADQLVQIPYPQWLIPLRSALSDIWDRVCRSDEAPDQRDLIKAALPSGPSGELSYSSTDPQASTALRADQQLAGSLRGFLADMIDEAAGRPVRLEDCDTLYCELTEFRRQQRQLLTRSQVLSP